ncbi:SDR family NAD(P)-dependent oxidoreductase [Paractinoplanes lichenicola]|uniref:SDR family NAD(P)-dependent oxidoreductase n=1 Tax=Paractinoplanes lichenicola TaxID=2802976 RepID=A0ABS1VZK0_9ACTN|nr:SDR family NAD(P)-dependent oxidoreductase [Actinoplanes lichenicola]MBL7259911.1 SDR family NAD(P)-dependent oxidoreductase [Actinoplanes lichenicola]
MSKTIAILGTGTGLGTSVARRFGREGYRVALVARTRERLEALAAQLTAEGVEAAAFPADLSRPADVRAALAAIGHVDVLEYAPITTEGFTAAAELTVEKLRPYADTYLFGLVEAVQAVLPAMLERGDGAILVGQGVSAVHPRPYLSGLGPVMAAARNYVHSLHAELADRGVYAGVVHVAALIKRSAGEASLPAGIDPATIPSIDPDDIADALWSMATKRDEIERLLPEA